MPLTCPNCDSENVIAREVRAIYVNTYEHYCHSVKAHDDNAECNCLDCDWDGKRNQLKGEFDE